MHLWHPCLVPGGQHVWSWSSAQYPLPPGVFVPHIPHSLGMESYHSMERPALLSVEDSLFLL